MRLQNRQIIFGLLSLAITFSSCKTDNEALTQEFGNIPHELKDSLKSIGQELQQNLVDPTKDNVIKGKNGTIIHIPANSLIGENGVPISSQTTVELKEHYSIVDFVTSNLQTVHNSDILQTQGMIYFAAKTTNGTIVKIDKSKPLRIEFPINERINEAKIFTGKRDDNGYLNWDSISEPSKYLIPYPIRVISRNEFPTECPNFYGITTDTTRDGYFNYYGDLSKFENTLLATREFKDRYNVACWKEIVDIYANNIDKNLWEIDELVVKHFIQDSTERVNYQINWRPPGIKGGPRTKAQDEAHEWLVNSAKESGHRMITVFKSFASQKLTTIDPTKRLADTTVAEMTKAFIAYDALEFGWVNVDYFFNDPKSVDIKLIAKANETVPIINLIIPNRNVILSGISKDDNTYYFTKNENGYNKLPKGEKGIIIAIAIKDNKLHFAEKEITIGQNETEVIELKPTTAETIKTRLKNYGS
ncbi:MAG: hypothetical protein ACK514_01300 [Bacteroidota bacterium]|jgi:hypothetical protein|nr:hypothetical protein [Cytophagales bacterium]MCA6429768.1 hypothetical protein [Cytophagales bacterium]